MSPKISAQFDPAYYAPVADRITLFFQANPQGRIVTELVSGLTVGLIGAYFVGRSMQSTLYGIGKLDLSVFASVALLLLFAAIIACLVPARRAGRVDPIIALRSE